MTHKFLGTHLNFVITNYLLFTKYYGIKENFKLRLYRAKCYNLAEITLFSLKFSDKFNRLVMSVYR